MCIQTSRPSYYTYAIGFLLAISRAQEEVFFWWMVAFEEWRWPVWCHRSLWRTSSSLFNRQKNPEFPGFFELSSGHATNSYGKWWLSNRVKLSMDNGPYAINCWCYDQRSAVDSNDARLSTIPMGSTNLCAAWFLQYALPMWNVTM